MLGRDSKLAELFFKGQKGVQSTEKNELEKSKQEKNISNLTLENLQLHDRQTQ